MIQNQKSLCNRFEIASKSLFDARNYMYKAMVKKLQVEPPERIVQKLSKEARRRWKQDLATARTRLALNRPDL